MSVAISARTPAYRPSPPPPPPPQQRLASKMPARVQARPVASRPVASKPSSAGGPQQQQHLASSAFPSSSSSSSSAPSARAGPSRVAAAAAAAGSSPAATTSGAMAPSPRQPVALAAPPGGKDLSSSTGKIFAKPSKEWVLPERAKPGRKASTDEPDNRRQSQNRLSQRAHRARRTDYIQTLEERLRKYEADEIHSNVRLQEVARALKQDNERMKKEIAALTAGLSAARTDRDTWQAERRQLNNQVRSLQNQLAQAEHRSPREYEYADADYATSELGLRHSPGLTPLSAASPRNLVPPQQVGTPRMSAASVSASRSAPTALACPICPDPDPDCPCQQGNIGNTLTTLGPSRCGFCDLAPEACLCSGTGGSSGVSRVVTMDDEDIKPIIPRSPSPVPADERGECGLCTSEDFCACRAGLNFASMVMSSPLIPPPAALPVAAAAAVLLPQSTGVAAPAVALRLRTRPAAKQSVWALDNVPTGTSRKEAVCTGDPSNCDACRNDSFGREFCENLFGTHDDEPSGSGSVSNNANGAAAPKKKCAGCGPGGCGSAPSVSIASLVNPPSSPIPQAPLVLACCGAPELCGHAGGCAGEVLIGPVDHDQLDDEGDNDEEVMRPDEAWHALKAHPNSRFTPLAILADVVARRSKCLGPRVELSPPPEGVPPHHLPAPPSPIVANAAAAQQQARARASAHKRRLAVETSAVRDALKFLDSATPAPESGRDAKRARV